MIIEPMGEPAPKPVTLKSIAERAGVSVQTVSTVLNDSRSNTVVSAETRSRIVTIAEEMQYRRNPLARSLRRGYTNIIGFYTGYGTVSHTNPFIAEVFGGIQNGCNECRKDLLIHGTFRGDSVDDIYNELTSGKIDGLVIFAPQNDSLVRRLQAAPLPVVSIAERLPGIVSVTMDDVAGGKAVAKHLHELGHRRILYISAEDGFISAFQRLEGVLIEAAQRGVAVTSLGLKAGVIMTLSETAKDLMTSRAPDRHTAVVCWCDALAEEVLRFLLDKGVSVPDEMAVVGFDGFNLPFAGGARLTTMVAPWAEAGHRAVSVLTRAGLPHNPATEEIMFPLQLRCGDTT